MLFFTRSCTALRDLLPSTTGQKSTTYPTRPPNCHVIYIQPLARSCTASRDPVVIDGKAFDQLASHGRDQHPSDLALAPTAAVQSPPG